MRLYAVCLSIVLWSGSGFADDLVEARAHYKRATAAYALSNYAEAAAEYESAFKFIQDPAILYNAAQAHRAAGNKERALQLYQNYLRVFAGRVENRAEVERLIASLKQAIESEQHAVKQPPTDPTPTPPVVKPVETKPASAQAVSATVVEATAKPATRPRSKAWVGGVVASVIAVVGVSVGLGLGLGLQPANPSPTFGVFKAQ